jgi:IclR family pca regulon transcriptional regulator
MPHLKPRPVAARPLRATFPVPAEVVSADFVAMNQSLARGLAILQAFDSEYPEWGVRELARKLDLDRSVVSRLVQTLAAAGFLEKNSLTSRYRIGPRAFEVGQRYTHSGPLYDIALSQMRDLHEHHQLDVYLAVRLETVVLYLGAIEADDVVFRAIAGTRGHLHSTSLGKALLAFEKDDVMREIVGRISLARLTPATKVSRPALIKELASVRKQGYATSNGENLPRIFSVSAPIFDASGKVVAAMSGSYPKDKMSKQRLDDMVEAMTSSAGHISRLLGHSNDMHRPIPALSIRLPKPISRMRS